MADIEEIMGTILPPPSAALPDPAALAWSPSLQGLAILALVGAVAIFLGALGKAPRRTSAPRTPWRSRLREAT